MNPTHILHSLSEGEANRIVSDLSELSISAWAVNHDKEKKLFRVELEAAAPQMLQDMVLLYACGYRLGKQEKKT